MHSLLSFVRSGTFKFTYEGQRVAGDQTPAEVRFLQSFPLYDLLLIALPSQLSMDDGDQLDAFLEQVRSGSSSLSDFAFAVAISLIFSSSLGRGVYSL